MNNSASPMSSGALLEANQRLHHLRLQKQLRQATTSTSMAFGGFVSAETPNPWLPKPTPTHTPQTNVHTKPQKRHISLFPDIGLAMLRTNQAAAGRVWLLLRYLDQLGAGWVSIEQAKAQLTGKAGELRIVGWRQLRNLLRQGQGIFWQRDKTRIWLRSTDKVAASLQVEKITSQAITIPLRALLNGIGDVRAHFYASFHSGRTQNDASERRQPIARETLTAISGVGRCSQRNYEQRTGVAVQTNIALGAEFSAETAHQELAWQQGNALFILKDKHGKQGEQGKRYFAWQLPNSYVGPHSQKSKSQKRRLNQKLADLLNTRATGNNKPTIEKRYFVNGSKAINVGFGRNQTPCYLLPAGQKIWRTLK